MKIHTQITTLATAAGLTLAAGSANAASITYSAATDIAQRSTFDATVYNAAAGADKLVIIATGEHNFGNASGAITDISYGGVSLTKAVQREAIDGHVTVAGIWYMDNPAASGLLGATVGGNGNNYTFSVMTLDNALAGIGNTAMVDDSKSVTFSAVGADSLILTSHALGGGGNNGDTGGVDTTAPLIEHTAIDVSNWAGHVVGVQNGVGAGSGTYTYTGGAATGNVTLGVEFLAVPVPEPSTTALLGLGGLALILRRRK